jgi:hypothetical protein
MSLHHDPADCQVIDADPVEHDWSWAFGPPTGPNDYFRPIPGNRDGNALVDRDGRVWKVSTGYVLRSKRSDIKSPYYNVGIMVNGKTKSFLVHQLVLEAFVGPRPKGYHACHNDGNPHNNRVDNLRWDTVWANMKDRTDQGGTLMGSAHGSAKLVESDISEILRLYREGVRVSVIARKYPLAPRSVWKIVKGETWKHVPRGPGDIPARKVGHGSGAPH